MRKKITAVLIAVVLSVSMLCGCGDGDYGTIYTFEEACKKELLTTEDLQIFANYYNSNTYCKDKLPDETKRRIRQAYLQEIKKTNPNAKLYKIHIGTYYGTYNGAVLVIINDGYFVCDIITYPEYTINGITFYYFSPAFLYVWTEK